MQSFFEFFAGVDSVLSVLAAIAAVLLFGLRSHVRFEIALSPWRDPTLMGIYVSGRSRARNVDLCFRAVGIGGKLRLVPDACEEICRDVIRPVEPHRSVHLEVQLSGEGNVWSEDLLFRLDPGFKGGFVLLIPSGMTLFSSLFSWKLIRIPRRP